MAFSCSWERWAHLNGDGVIYLVQLHVELDDTDVQNLDDILPRMLLKFGVQAY